MIGEVPHEEYILTTEELNMLKAKDERMYETYWKMMCHFYICVDILGTKGPGSWS